MRLVDADELEKQGWTMHRTVFVNPQTMEMQVKKPTDFPAIVDAVPVVRCKDCKWWDKSEDSPFGYCMAIKHGYFSKNWEIGIYRRYKGDFYCADAERSKE